ncbi:protein of unknown function [Shewanella benthica]|uniref:Uncharacterized protein n=1 Tax=Shewanella benthica TaxID=43661 RepID=A0A330M171_9GAMM|nr:protein of unknown function [Shewanella benthica]
MGHAQRGSRWKVKRMLINSQAKDGIYLTFYDGTCSMWFKVEGKEGIT